MMLWFDGKFVLCLSKWNMWEFYDQLHKLFLERKLIENGYALHEFSQAKKVINLEDNDLAWAFDIVDATKKGSYYNTINLQLKMIDSLVLEGFSMMDSILLFQAKMNPICQYFVTRDNRLIENVKNLDFEIGDLEIKNRKEFLMIIDKN